MKRVLLISLVALTPCLGSQDQPTQAELSQTLDHLIGIVKSAQDDVKTANDSATKSKGELAATNIELGKYKGQVEILTQSAAKDHDTVLEQKAAISRRDLIIAVEGGIILLIIGAAGVFLYLKGMFPI